jgi:hypothetical protein
MSRLSKSRVLNTFLAPFEAQILFKESTTLRDFWWPTWGAGWLNGIGDLWLKSGKKLLTNGDVMGGTSTREFSSKSSLRIVINSSECSTFKPVARMSWTVPVEDWWGVTSSVDVTITESVTPYTRYLLGLSNHCLESSSHTGDCPMVWTKSL